MTPDQKTCIACQECCKWLTFILTNQTFEENWEAYEARGCLGIKVEGENFTGVMVPTVCQHLSALGCGIYETRPKQCRDYDGRTDPFMQHKCKLSRKVE